MIKGNIVIFYQIVLIYYWFVFDKVKIKCFDSSVLYVNWTDTI